MGRTRYENRAITTTGGWSPIRAPCKGVCFIAAFESSYRVSRFRPFTCDLRDSHARYYAHGC